MKPDCTWIKLRHVLPAWLLSSLVAWCCSSSSGSSSSGGGGTSSGSGGKPRWPCCLLHKLLLLLVLPAVVGPCPSLIIPSSVQLWNVILSPGLLPPVWRSLLHTWLTVWAFCRQAPGCEKQAAWQKSITRMRSFGSVL